MAAGCAVSGWLIDRAAARGFSRELWLGMLAPFTAVAVSWAMTVRVYRADPRRVTALMMGAFAGKLMFFGGYVALAIVALGVQPVPFALSLTGYFIVLHIVEALLLKRLFV